MRYIASLRRIVMLRNYAESREIDSTCENNVDFRIGKKKHLPGRPTENVGISSLKFTNFSSVTSLQ